MSWFMEKAQVQNEENNYHYTENTKKQRFPITSKKGKYVCVKNSLQLEVPEVHGHYQFKKCL